MNRRNRVPPFGFMRGFSGFDGILGSYFVGVMRMGGSFFWRVVKFMRQMGSFSIFINSPCSLYI